MGCVSSELVEQFQRDGFVVVPGLLAAEELIRGGVACAAAVAARKSHDSRVVSEKSRYE